MKSLSNAFDDLVYHFQPHDDTPRSWRDLHDYEWWARHPNQQPDVIQMAQRRDEHPSQAGPHQTTTSRQEVLNYLGQLADDYHVPRRVLYALAEAESHINPEIDPQPNYKKKHGKFVLDKQGNKKVISWDYGLLQINGGTIGKKVKDSTGHVFHVEPGVKDKANWKANASAGVAIFADAYHLAQFEQGPGTQRKITHSRPTPNITVGVPEQGKGTSRRRMACRRTARIATSCGPMNSGNT